MNGAYLEARRTWKATIAAQWAVYEDMKRGIATRAEFEAALQRTRETFSAMKAAERAAS